MNTSRSEQGPLFNVSGLGLNGTLDEKLYSMSVSTHSQEKRRENGVVNIFQEANTDQNTALGHKDPKSGSWAPGRERSP